MNPLNINSDPENRNQRLETLIIPNRFCSDDEVTGSGGRCTIILPSRGNLSGDSRLILPATCADDCYQYSPVSGCLCLISQASFRVGDVTVCQLDRARKLYVQQSLLKHPERRELVDSVLHGVNSSFETCSGGKRNADPAQAESLSGQMRLVTDGYTKLEPSLVVPGRTGPRPCLMNGEVFENYRLKTFYNDTSDQAGTPEFSISLQQLFPGMFKNHLSFPLHLVDRDDEIAIEIVFSQNGDWASNERAVLCPELQTLAKSGMVFPSVITQGDDAADQTNVVKKAKDADGTINATVMFDTDGTGKTKNIRVIDPGSGYSASDEVIFELTGNNLKLRAAASNFTAASGNNNFIITPAGTGYTEGAVTIVDLLDSNNTASGTITVSGTAVTSLDIDASSIAEFAIMSDSTYKIEQTGSDGAARGLVPRQNFDANCDTLAGGTFDVGDLIELTATTTTRAHVLAVDGTGLPTKLATISDWADTVTGEIRKVSETSLKCNIVALSNGREVTEVTPLGSGGLASYDVVSTGGKINIVTNKVRLATDLIFNDVQDEMDKKLMMESGIIKIYTQFRNVETTLEGGTVSDYGAFQEIKSTKLIGYSNEVLRNLMIASCPSGTQSDINFENYTFAKKNPLLLDFVSRDSLKEDGVELQLTINSVPRYSSPLSTNCHLYTEYSDMTGRPLYVPRGAYCGYLDCKQRDEKNLIKDSKQPGFQDLDGAVNADGDYKATLQYEQNDRKAGFSNQNWQGINQKWMRGNLSYMGIPLKLSTGNMLNNGVRVGSQAIQIDYTYNHTKNPYYSGPSVLSVFGEVERVFSLFRGKVSVSSAAE